MKKYYDRSLLEAIREEEEYSKKQREAELRVKLWRLRRKLRLGSPEFSHN